MIQVSGRCKLCGGRLPQALTFAADRLCSYSPLPLLASLYTISSHRPHQPLNQLLLEQIDACSLYGPHSLLSEKRIIPRGFCASHQNNIPLASSSLGHTNTASPQGCLSQRLSLASQARGVTASQCPVSASLLLVPYFFQCFIIPVSHFWLPNLLLFYSRFTIPSHLSVPRVPSQHPYFPSRYPNVPSQHPTVPSQHPSVPSQYPSVPSQHPTPVSQCPIVTSQCPIPASYLSIPVSLHHSHIRPIKCPSTHLSLFSLSVFQCNTASTSQLPRNVQV